MFEDVNNNLLFLYAATRFITEQTKKDVGVQLSERSISGVMVSNEVKGKPLVISQSRKGFKIVVPNIEERHQFDLIGAAIAETFGYNLTTTPPVRYVPDALEGDFRKFRQKFAEEWVRRNTPEKIRQCLGSGSELQYPRLPVLA